MKPQTKPKQAPPPKNHPWRAFNYRAKRNTTAIPSPRFRMIPQ